MAVFISLSMGELALAASTYLSPIMPIIYVKKWLPGQFFNMVTNGNLAKVTVEPWVCSSFTVPSVFEE